jgi:signal peptidase I
VQALRADERLDSPRAALPDPTGANGGSSAGQVLGASAGPAPAYSAARPPTRRGAAAQAAMLAVLLWVCAFHLSVVRGSSMLPGIQDGDRILIEPCVDLLGGPVQRGDVVVLKNPFDPSVDYIKRVIGLPGDDVVLEGGRVWVNGELLQEPYVEEQDPFARVSTRVKPAHYFVLGDNRQRSCDSREFGQVGQDYVLGRVRLRIWPPQRFGSL